jgi:hypothetical protein
MNSIEPRVIKHSSYDYLSDSLINARFDGVGVVEAKREKMSYDLIRDLAYYHSYFFMGEDPKKALIDAHTAYKREDFNSDEEYWERIAYHNNIINFIRDININIFTGNTPAQKAASVMLSILAMDNEKDNSEKNGAMMDFFKPTDEEIDKAKEGKLNNGREIPTETKKNNKESVNGSVAGGQGRADRVTLLEDYVHTTINYAIDSPIASEYFNTTTTNGELALFNMTNEQRILINQLSIVSSMGKLNTRKKRPGKCYGLMNDIGDIVHASPRSQLLSPILPIKLIEKTLTTSKSKQGGKQILIYLIDDSGSMSVIEKVRWVKTLMINRLDAVAKNKAELYVAWYIEDIIPKSIIHIKNKAQAIEFSKKQFFGNFNGGGTNIARAIESTVNSIKSNNFYGNPIKGVNPQIVLINDGQDFIDKNYEVGKGITLNSFILGGDNKNLEIVTRRSGGTYVRFL